MEQGIKYEYTNEQPYRCEEMSGLFFDIKKGDILVKRGDYYIFGAHVIKNDKELKRSLGRFLTDEEKKYYRGLRDRAAVAVSPCFTNAGSNEAAVNKAVEYANALVERLMNNE